MTEKEKKLEMKHFWIALLYYTCSWRVIL